MALVARIVPANGGRIIEKRLVKGVARLAVPEGANLEIVDSATGQHVRAQTAEASGQDVLLKFARPEGDILLELSGAVSGFAAALSDAVAADAAAEAVDEGAQDTSDDSAAEDGGAVSDSSESGRGGGASPVLLGILGLGALGGIAAAVSGGGSKDAGDSDPGDVVAPPAPTSLILAADDDTGILDDDRITGNASGLTISGKAEPLAKVELFDGATSLGIATADASGNFTLDVALAEGVHSITAKATDAAGNVSVASGALSITVDTTAPTAAIALSATSLSEGDTAVVTITFSEPVTDFDLDDLTVGSGVLSDLVSADGGLTWTATFTPDADVTDLTNVIALGTGYADIAGNAGTEAVSDNYSVETLTFVVADGEDGVVDFGGTATGPITITLNASDEAVFSRGGKDADTVIGSISSKVMNVPEGGTLNIVIDGAATSDTFTLDAPNAAALVFTGNGGGLDDALNIIIQSATADADLRTLKVDTSGLTGVETIRFVFPEDAQDVVKLTADSDLTGFSAIEVSKGGVDLTAVNVQPGVEFVVNSTLIVTLAQFKALSSIISVTGLGNLSINLTADEVQSHALEAFLESAADKPVLIGTTVTVRGPDNEAVPVPDALDAISYDSIPGLSDRIDALEARLGDLDIDDVVGLGDVLSDLSGTISVLQSAIGTSGELATRLDALEAQLAGIADTVVVYVNAQIDALRDDAQGEDGPTLDSIAGLRAAIEALQSFAGEDGALASQLEELQSQIDDIAAHIDTTAPTVLDVQLSATGADAAGHLNAGDVVTATVHFSEVVLVAGQPTLQLIIGDDVVDATLVGGAGTDTLTFAYTIREEDHDADGISIAEDALILGTGGSITDRAGNALNPHFDAIGDDDGLIVDNGPLSLEMDNSAIFGAVDHGDAAILGLLYIEGAYQPITLDDVDSDGNYEVPEGGTFVPMNDLVAIAFRGESLTELDAEWLEEHALSGGETYVVALEGKRVIELDASSLLSGEVLGGLLGETYPQSVSVLASDAELREWLGSRAGQAVLALAGVSTVDEFVESYTHSLTEASAATTFDPTFLAQIAGHDPADVQLTIHGPLTVAQAAALAAAGFDLGGNVSYGVQDYYTTIQAALANPAQQAVLEGAQQVLARGDELDNAASMTAFDSDVNLRTELGAGDDVYNAGRGNEVIVGQAGADTINLTSRDNSTDVIVYQSAYDGRTPGVSELTYSTGEDDYREGSKISITINGHVYSYTVRGDDGETPAEALQHLADKVMDKQVTGRVVIGMLYPTPIKDKGIGDPVLVYQDEMKDGVYTVPSGYRFLSSSEYLNAVTRGEDSNAELAALGISGGQTFHLSSEQYLDIDSRYWRYSDTLLEDQIILADTAAYQNYLDKSQHGRHDRYNSWSAARAVAEAIRYTDVAAVHVDAETGALTVVGGDAGRDLTVLGGNGKGGEDYQAIVNHGQPAVASVAFSHDWKDYPGEKNWGHTTSFDRELRITINGVTVTAEVVAGNPLWSVANLKAAIKAAMAEDATNAITAAYSTVDLAGLVPEGTTLDGETQLEPYSLTLTVNGITVQIESGEDGGTLSDLIGQIKAVGGVQSVEFKDGSLVVTAEVRGASVPTDDDDNGGLNSIHIGDFTVGETVLEATDTAAVAGSLHDVISGVSQRGTELTLTGFVPESDGDAPTIVIDNAEIDKRGVQQQLDIHFSGATADYYAGGHLSVTINGEDFTVDMVATGDHYDPFLSLQALANRINAQAGEDDVPVEKATVTGDGHGGYMLHIVSSSEAPDALTVDGLKQSYRGEEQTATITLEDALTYNGAMGDHAIGDDRLANVYFEGGKVYATFVPHVEGEDGQMVDGEPVTVSADMVMEPGYSRFDPANNYNLAAEGFYLGGSAFAFSITIDGQDYTRAEFEAYLSTLDPALVVASDADYDEATTATFADLADWLETLDGVAKVALDPITGLTVTYDHGVSGTINSFQGSTYIDHAFQFSLGSATLTKIVNDPGGKVGDPHATAQALADAINTAATKQVAHFTMDLDGHDPLTLETELLTTGVSAKVNMAVSVNGEGELIWIAGYEHPEIATIGDLIGWLNEQYEGLGVWSLNAAGNGFDLTTAGDAIVEGTGVGLILGDDAILHSGPATIVAPTLPFIGHAEVGEDGTITVTASEVGKDTFQISDVTMDYEGIQQIATVTYDASGDYYGGGTLSIDIDADLGAGGGTADIIHIQASMVEGDRMASLRNLVDEINSYTKEGETAARAFMKGSELLNDEVTNGGGDLEDKIYFSSWSVTVGTGVDAVTYSGRGEAVVVDGVTEWHDLGGYGSEFANLGAFHDFIKGLPGVDNATLDEHGNIVITSDAVGSSAYISGAFDLAVRADDPEGPHVSASAFDYGSSGALAGIIDRAELDEETGEITLVAAEAGEQQFAIHDADLSEKPVFQAADAQFGEDLGDHFYEGGKIGLTVNGVTVETDMVMDEGVADPEATLQNLRNAIWAEVNEPTTLTIDLSGLETLPDEGAYIGNNWSVAIHYANGEEASIDAGIFQWFPDLLNAVKGLDGVADAALVGSSIVVTTLPGVGAFTLDITGIYDSLEGLADTLNGEHEAASLSGAFSSVTVGEDGTIHFVAANAADGLGEIDISDVHMSLEAREQITEISFGVTGGASLALANGLADEDGDHAQVSVTIAGQTISADTQGNDADTIRALAQAIIEARDGTFVDHAAGVGRDPQPAEVRIDLPDGIDADSLILRDGTHDSVIDFEIYFSDDGDADAFIPSWDSELSMTTAELVVALNGQLDSWASLRDIETPGVFAYDAETNQIVLTSTALGEDAYVNVQTADISFWEEGSAAFAWSQDQTDEAGSASLPEGVAGDSVITEDPVINVSFTDGESGGVILGSDSFPGFFVGKTLNELIDHLNSTESGRLGSYGLHISLDGDGHLAVTYDAVLYPYYQINSFDIPGFSTYVETTGTTVSAAEDYGDVGPLVIQTDDDRAISADDAISMDKVSVTLTIDGEDQTHVFTPDLVERPGQARPSVGDFMEWLEESFSGVTASIVDGKIVLTGDDLTGAEAALTLLDAYDAASATAMSFAAGEITLGAFAGLTEETRLVGHVEDFDIFVGSNPVTGTIVTISYEVQEGSTLGDLIEAIESQARQQLDGDDLTARFIEGQGIVLSVEGAEYSGLSLPDGLSLSYAVSGTDGNAAIGEVDLSGSSILVHGAGTGPDPLNIGSFSYDQVDTSTSSHEQVVLGFNNSRLDATSAGDTVSVTLFGKTTTLELVNGPASEGEVDVSGATGAGRSSVILDALIGQLEIDHPELEGLIVRGSYDPGTETFTEGSGNSAVYLRFTANAYGHEIFGVLEDLRSTIVDSNPEPYRNSAELLQAGVVHFTSGADGTAVYDGSDESGRGQAGRDESGIYYVVDEDGAHYVLVDPDHPDGVILEAPTGGSGLDPTSEFDNLGIVDDVVTGQAPGTIDQDYVNPGDGSDGTDSSYYGDAPSFVEDEDGNGVRQSHQNPGGGYTATDGSPVANDNDAPGSDDLYGGASGYYDEEGHLHTDHLDGATGTSGDDGDYYYDVDKGLDATTGVTGAYHGEKTDSDSAHDHFRVNELQDGFAAFTWDDVLHDPKTGANAGADVINNFQVAHDYIAFEGAIEDSMAVGDVNRVQAERGDERGFSLDHSEFGIVGSDASDLGVNGLSDAHAVSALLESLFDLSANDDDGQKNSSVFAVTAKDDPTTTAIWAHTQSSADDCTIDANELSLLAIVNTTGGEFGAHNLQLMTYHYDGPVI